MFLHLVSEVWNVIKINVFNLQILIILSNNMKIIFGFLLSIDAAAVLFF
jgi:hypothetical protein